MDIVKKFQKASIEEIEAHIERVVNERDAVNIELLALNRLRDSKVREKEREKAAAEFEAKYGQPPTQTIHPGSAVSSPKVHGAGLLEGFLSMFGGKK